MARFAQSSPRALPTIRRRETFDTTGNLSGDVCDRDPRTLVNVGWGGHHPWFSRALIAAAELGGRVDYVLWSFRTPIAVHITVSGDASVARSYWIVDVVSYSGYSARALSVVRQALSADGVDPVIETGRLYYGWKSLTDLQRSTIIESGDLGFLASTVHPSTRRSLIKRGYVIEDEKFGRSHDRLSKLAHDTLAEIKVIR